MTEIIESVTRVGAFRPLAEGVRNRFVVAPDDLRRNSPFVLLVEDWIEPGVPAYGMHPHRGFETVTLLLQGTERYEDHLGTTGIAHAGDVQWTTAGRGIFHGGRPEGNERLHALQLWLNLPAALKSMAPCTHLQRLADTEVDMDNGVRVVVHAGAYKGHVQPHLSLWPLTLIEASLQAGCFVRLDADPHWRSFLYVLRGQISIGDRTVSDGEVAWLKRNDAASPFAVRIEASAEAHVFYYAGLPINEPVALGGPFVMNDEAEIRQAYADLNDESFLRA